MIKETGWKGKLSATVGTPVALAALKIEKLRYFRSQRIRRAENARCQLTHWGDFDHTYSRGVPKPKRASQSVRIERQVRNEAQAPEAILTSEVLP